MAKKESAAGYTLCNFAKLRFMRILLRKLLIPVEYLLVFLYILFEEIVWESMAEPIYESIRSLGILQRLEYLVMGLHRYLVLLLFMRLFITVEGTGLAAGALVLGGHPLYGKLLYTLKIPVAAFTFWLFHISREKLMSFAWFRVGYMFLMAWLARLKETEIYQRSMKRLKEIKILAGRAIAAFRKRLQSEGSIFRMLGRLYRFFKKKI